MAGEGDTLTGGDLYAVSFVALNCWIYVVYEGYCTT